MRRVGIVGITLVGLWTLVQSATLLVTSISLTSSGSTGAATTYKLGFYVAPGVLFFAIGCALIALRRRLAERWFEDEPLDAVLAPVPLLRLGLILLSVWLVATALPEVFAALSRPIIAATNDRMQFGPDAAPPPPLWTVLPTVIGSLVQLCMAALVLAFSRPLSMRLWMPRKRETDTLEADLPSCPACGAHYDPRDYVPESTWRCVECGQPLGPPGA